MNALRRALRLGIVATAASLLVHRAEAQGAASPELGGKARYRAVVRNAGGQPVANARVRLAGLRAALTDARGWVVLDSLAAGPQSLEVLALGYAPERRMVVASTRSVPPDTIVLTSLESLDTVRVSGGRDGTGFDARRSGRVGQFITATDIAREKPKNTTALLRTREGMLQTLDPSGSPVLKMTTGPDRSCNPLVWLDGFPAPPTPAPRGFGPGERAGSPAAFSLNWGIRPDEIGGVEIYNSPAMVPARFADPDPRRAMDPRRACGAIVIWTREKLGLPRSAPAPP